MKCLVFSKQDEDSPCWLWLFFVSFSFSFFVYQIIESVHLKVSILNERETLGRFENENDSKMRNNDERVMSMDERF